MTDKIFNILLTLLIALTPVLANAQDETGNPPNWCRNGHFPSEKVEFKLAKINAAKGEKVYFYNDFGADCPSNNARCQAKSYLVAGDEVLVSRTFNSYVCAWFEPRKGNETVGWIEEKSLIISPPDKKPALNKWIGNWEDGEDWLGVQPDKKSGFLAVEGDAFWFGLGENVHVGAISSKGAPAENVLNLTDSICQMSLKLVGNFLIVSDNGECGGVNVKFDGVYQKSKDRKPRRSKVIGDILNQN